MAKGNASTVKEVTKDNNGVIWWWQMCVIVSLQRSVNKNVFLKLLKNI